MKAAPRHLVPQHPPDVGPVLLGYQQKLLASTAMQVIVAEKSRRIGFSWAAASEAVTVSAASADAGGMNTLYIGYNLEMAREFIGDCGFWAKHLHGFAAEVQEFAFADADDKHGEKSIKAFRVTFASGFEIIALSSRPRSLRGMQGFVIIDEAAFHDDLPGLIKAAMALLIWGGKVWFISTHDGADNAFNEMVEDIRAGRKPYKLIRVTFADVVADGLYRRICLVAGKPWTQEAEDAWVKEVRGYYGDDAAEELDVIPRQGSGVFLTRALIDSCMNADSKVVYLRCEDGFELKPDEERAPFIQAWLEDNVAPLLATIDPRLLSFVGGDFARTADLTCLWPGQLRGDKLVVPFAIELRNVPFTDQEAILWYLFDGLGATFSAAALDARGLGAMMAERAMQKYGERVARVMATLDWYRDNMPGYKARYEDRTIEIPRDDDIRNDHRLIRQTRGVAMVPDNAHVASSRGGKRHGDSAIAGVMLHFASKMDVISYDGYRAAGTRRGKYDADGQHEDIGRGHGLKRIKGAW